MKPIAADEVISDDITVVVEHILWLAACAPKSMDDDVVESTLQTRRVSGTRAGWTLARDREDWRVQCGEDDSRWHYLFLC